MTVVIDIVDINQLDQGPLHQFTAPECFRKLLSPYTYPEQYLFPGEEDLVTYDSIAGIEVAILTTELTQRLDDELSRFIHWRASHKTMDFLVRIVDRLRDVMTRASTLTSIRLIIR